MGKFTLSLLFVVFVSLALVATGSAEEPDGPVTVTIGYNRFLESSFGVGAAPVEVIEQAVAAEYPEITAELNVLPDTVTGMRDAIAVWMLAGDGTVDIYGMDSPWIAEFGQAGWAVDLSNDVSELSESCIDTGVETFSYDGALLAIPFWGGIWGLYYRTDLMDEYGFDASATYDDLVAISETILEDQPEFNAFAWHGAQEEALVMVFADFLYGFGALAGATRIPTEPTRLTHRR